MKIDVDFQIETDGITVWINSAYGYCLGRFGKMGVDVHIPPPGYGPKRISNASPANGGECAFCTHGPVTKGDWDVFVREMKNVHDIDVDDVFMPKRFRV